MINKRLLPLIFILFFCYLLPAKTFDMKTFSDPHRYGWDSPQKQLRARKDLLERQKLLQVYEMNKFNYRDKVLKSALVPGWAHFATGRYTKGQVLLCLEVGMFVSSFYYYDKAMNYYDKYKEAEYIGDISDYYEKAREPWHFSQAFLGLGVLVWLYNIYDSFLVVDQYNSDLWQKIYNDNKNNIIALTPTGITVRFK